MTTTTTTDHDPARALCPRPYPPRYIYSYHPTADHQYRAVVVRWHRDRFTRVRGELHDAHTAPTIRLLWCWLVANGYIDARLDDLGAYRTFTTLGRIE